MNILIFTDSRGQHKPTDSTYSIFTERLFEDERLNIEMYNCPMKWTTTLDFLEMIQDKDLIKYDRVILYTGIVEWSPRPQSSAIHDLYNNQSVANLDAIKLNTRDYSKKIVNNKKPIFDQTFGTNRILSYLHQPFNTTYNNEVTINMYGLDMARDSLLPKLAAIENLLFINANRILSDWDGNYKKGRPQNMYVTHDYADLFSAHLKNKLVDLRVWSEGDIKKFTCDNMHLTQAGSDYIYNEITKVLEIKEEKFYSFVDSLEKENESVEKEAPELKPPERITGLKRKRVLELVNKENYLATIIIGYRQSEDDPERIKNLLYLIKWLEYFYEDIFQVIIVEQDTEPKLKVNDYSFPSFVSHNFIYNPHSYNRGWGYNVAIKHFTKEDVVILMDTDVLTGPNFVREVLDCFCKKYEAISPYRNIYYTDSTESEEIKGNFLLSIQPNPNNMKNPVSITGGILIIRRQTFIALAGFEQYVGYSCEDRALDVTLLNHIDQTKIRVAPFTYVHLYHPTDNKARVDFKAIYKHLIDNYNCKYDPTLSPYEFIHRNCQHVSKEQTLYNIIKRKPHFGDIDLYKTPLPSLTINGLIKVSTNLKDEYIFPPEFKNLSDYESKEFYDTPLQDTEELKQFYNAFQGKRCFIIGNGPSLNRHDLSKLEGEYSFGVNSFYYKTKETGFRPFFYVVEDSSVMKENIKEIIDFEAPFKFFPTIYEKLHPKTPNTFFFNMNRGFYEKSSPNYVVPRFSTDASKILYCGQSVTHINLQLAFYMGFTEVYLIGMDFNYVIPESHKRRGDVLLSDTDDPNHFHKDYFGKGKTWKDPKLDRVILNYRMAKLAFESVGRSVYNATIGGKLEIFPRVNYNALFNKSWYKKEKGLSTFKMSCDIFSKANQLYRNRQYEDALYLYIKLTEENSSFSLYKKALWNCYVDATNNENFVSKQLKIKIFNLMKGDS